MEPLHPEVRVALKDSHPGLTDEDIDRVEELLAQRMLCDPEKEVERITQLDQERMELIRRKMPRYTEVVQAVRARIGQLRESTARKVTVTPKRPKP